MPNAALILGQNLTTAGPYPYLIDIGGADVTLKSELQSLMFQDNGDDEPGRFTARVWDPTNSLVISDLAVVRVYEFSSNEQVWLGTVQRKKYLPAAVGRFIQIDAISISALLDEILVPRETRPAESDRARVLYLWGKYSRSPLSGDASFVTETDASIPADDLTSMTLRSALRQTMGLAGSTTRMAVDPLGKLHWFAGTETDPAPYNINRAMTPGGGNIAPDDLDVERDGVIKNRAFIRGMNDAGSGWYQNDASVALYGPRETYIDAPSADTAAKAQSISNLYFGRVGLPRTRGEFHTEEPYNGWRGGQNCTITDPANDLSAQSFRLARVTTTFTKGTGTRRYKIEFGSVRASDSDDANVVGGEAGVSQGISGQMVLGDLFDQFGNLMLSSATTGSYGGFGPAIRRYITSGVYNGDFGLAPQSPDSSINEAWNPLPFWTFTQASGTAITARSVADSASGSGRVLTLDMAGGGIAGDDSYIEQLIPINASRSQAYAYRLRCAFFGVPGAGTNARAYIKAAFVKADGVTLTGAEGVSELTTSAVPLQPGGVYDRSVAPGTADGIIGGQVPADAYYIRFRIGLKRDIEATSTADSVSIAEAHLITGASELIIEDLTTPANQPARFLRQAGITYLLSRGANAAGSAQSPAVTMNDTNDTVGISGSLTLSTSLTPPITSGYIQQSLALTASGNPHFATLGDGVRAKPITPVGWQPYAWPGGQAQYAEPTNTETLPINGGSLAMWFVVPAPMKAQGLVFRNKDAAGAHSLEFRLYLDTLNTSNTADEVTSARIATISYTPGGVSSQQTAFDGGAFYLPPGIYFGVLRNKSASVTAGVGVSAGAFPGIVHMKSKTLGSALGTTIDLVTGWSATNQSRLPAMALTGLVLNEAAGGAWSW